MNKDIHLICPGSGKSGTTSLYSILKEHPQICMSNIKEDNYFTKATDPNIADYHKTFFPHLNNNHKILGSICPIYMSYHDTAEKIYNVLGRETKIVFILRNPIDVSYSSYWMSYRRGFEKLSFDDAINIDNERMNQGDSEYFHFGYVYKSKFDIHLKYYYEKFDSIYVMVFEEFFKDINKEGKKLLEYLGLDTEFDFELNNKRENIGGMPRSNFFRKLHGQPMTIKKIAKNLIPNQKLRWKIYPIIERLNRSTKKYPKLNSQQRENLKEIFYPNILNLEKMIGRDLSIWYK